MTKNKMLVLTQVNLYGKRYNGITKEQLLRKVAGLGMSDLNEALAALVVEGAIEETNK